MNKEEIYKQISDWYACSGEPTIAIMISLYVGSSKRAAFVREVREILPDCECIIENDIPNYVMCLKITRNELA